MARWQKRDAKYLNAKAARLLAGVVFRGGYTFEVPSVSGGGPNRVDLNPDLQGGRCTCDWYLYASHSEKVRGDVVCAHILAALKWCAGESGRTLRAYASEEAAKRQKRASAGIGQGVYLVLRKI